MKQRFYDRLPVIWFTSKEAYSIAKEFNLENRTVRKYLKEFCDIKLVEKGKIGNYRKLLMPTMPSMPG